MEGFKIELPKLEKCPTCKGNGKIKEEKCPDCGGSGASDNIDVIEGADNPIIEDGKPKKNYEVIVRDVDKDKILYRKKSFGGVVCMIEGLKTFSSEMVEGDFRSAYWGHPLISRFALDRLEEDFSNHIPKFLEALQDSIGMPIDYEKTKASILLGSRLRLNALMEQGVKKAPSFIKEGNDGKLPESASDKTVEKVRQVMKNNNRYGVIVWEEHKETSSDQLDIILKGFTVEKMVTTIMDFVVSQRAKRDGIDITKTEDKVKETIKLLQELITSLQAFTPK
jgi:hypothetical protein